MPAPVQYQVRVLTLASDRGADRRGTRSAGARSARWASAQRLLGHAYACREAPPAQRLLGHAYACREAPNLLSSWRVPPRHAA